MLNHNSATERKETPHAINSAKKKTLNLNGTAKSTKSKPLNLNGTCKNTISSALKRRARSVIKDRSIDAQSRALIRYGLETNDPWLAELVRRADAGETIIYTVNSLKHPHPAKMIQAKKRLKH